VLEKQTGIKRLLDSFDPEEKRFPLIHASMDLYEISQVLYS